jgi:hypothetical protein
MAGRWDAGEELMRYPSTGRAEVRRDDRATSNGDVVLLYQAMVVHPGRSLVDTMVELGLDQERLVTALRRLESLRLVRPSPHPDRDWDAMSPDCALAELVAEDEAELCRRQAELAGLRREILGLLPTYVDASRACRTVEVDVVEDASAVRRLLSGWSRRTRHEVLVAHPGGGMSEASLARGLKLDLPVLRRGVRIRTLLQHSTRRHAPTRTYVETVVEGGAVIRTVPTVPGRMIAFDRSAAFIPLGHGVAGAALVRAPAVVDHLIAVFDALWVTGHPYLDTGDDVVRQVRDDERAVLLRQLASGAKDDVIARRLGMSVRTCRRHIAAVMAELGADSRFQAGVQVGRAGLLDDDHLGIGPA